MTHRSGSQAVSEDPDRRFSLLTINLWNGRADSRALDAVLARLSPDVVMAQELSHHCAEVLRARYPHCLLRPRADTLGMGLATRLGARFREVRMPRRTFPVARVAPFRGDPAVRVDLVNVHLSCPQTPVHLVERAVQVRRLLAMDAWDPVPRVLAGDFNTAPAMPTYGALRRRFEDAATSGGIRDGSRNACPGLRSGPHRRAEPPLGPTWGPTARSKRWLRIDHIMVSGLLADSLATVPVRGSDHDGVFARLTLPEP